MNRVFDFTRNFAKPRRWLVTGAAGFIGSHLVEYLLASQQIVVGLDNFSFGKRINLQAFQNHKNFDLITGDIRSVSDCQRACAEIDYVLHHAAMASVPLSFEDPAMVSSVNDGGFLTLFKAAAGAGVRRFIYASSSAVYGDNGTEPRQERHEVRPSSPYAISKYGNELYARVLGHRFGLETVGLRYFNVYGPRQSADGAYAAVIPKWVANIRAGQPVEIFGDGQTIRDFCYIGDVVKANIKAALSEFSDHQVFNIGSGQQTTLNELYQIMEELISPGAAVQYKDYRDGDIMVSCADISRARKYLGFQPRYSLKQGLAETVKANG